MDKQSQVDINQLFLETRNNINFQLLDAIQSLDTTIRKLNTIQGKIGAQSSERKKKTSVGALEIENFVKSKVEKVRGVLHQF